MMKRWLIGLLVGAGVGGVAYLLAILATGPGHGSGVPALLLFPFNRLLAEYFDPSMLVAAGVASLQYPVYGAVTGLFKSLGRGLTCVIAIHVAAAALALYVLDMVPF
jgi:hypothetical protein